MLYIMSGETESGKTTWICDFVKFLEKQNIPVAGVVAPGEFASYKDDCSKNTKIAINNVLLPSHTTIQIATRKDEHQDNDDNPVAKDEEQGSQSKEQIAKNKTYTPKKWNFDNLAFEKVNDYFKEMKQRSEQADKPHDKQAVLIIDELGPKELEYDEGLNHAVELLKNGPNAAYKDAIIVVRKHLADKACDKFIAWGKPVMINTNTCFGSMLDKIK